MDLVPVGVTVRETVWVGETVVVAVAVGLGEGSNKPWTYRGPAYCVPALVTESHTFAGKKPVVVPVRTLMRFSSP